MKKGLKTLQALLLAFAIALFLGATSSYAFTVKDGEEVLTSPDDKRWIERVGIYADGRLVIVNIFEGGKAETGLSVELSAADLRQSEDTSPYSGEVKYFLFVDNTTVFAELTKEDDAILLKDSTSTLINTGTEIPSEDIKGGTYNPPDDYRDYFFYGDESSIRELTSIIMFFLDKYEDIYNEMLVTYKPVEPGPEEDISGNDVSGNDVSDNDVSDNDVSDNDVSGNDISGNEDVTNQDEDPFEDLDWPIIGMEPPIISKPTPNPVPVPVPAPTPGPDLNQEIIREKEIVRNEPVANEPVTKTPPAEKVPEQNKEETVQIIKSEDTVLPKRVETSIIGEVLNHRVAATVPVGVDERSVSKLQKQISDTIDGLIQEISADPDSAKERVSEETLTKIEKAISEGKEISAEVVVEKVEADSISERDKEAFARVTSDNEHSNLKIGRYFDISILIKTDDGEELGTYNEMTDKVTLTLPKPKDIPCPKGMEYVVIRIHDNETTIIPVRVNRDGSLSFETDRFSSYALAVREVVDEETAKAAALDSARAAAGGDDLMDFVKWFVRILLFAFASGTIVILSSFIDKRRTNKK